ncbi:hypothetical protein CEG14_21330 [Bordetella genomosp. 1]|uniref:Uncharacterized protein n=1 Tax=Bordetella genomosp. 1 TaxID=1395607 RepID=A0A261RY28_9BORD|nr:hypothetical protein [Bordetella genomosp. 1]OZI29173.1 hypothetical protein CEG14_21330 [Bordetella genomosp. 1]
MLDFEDHFYYPSLMSRVAEIQGLRELDDALKQRIIPLFTLGKWHNAVAFDRAIENCVSALGPGRPFVADLTREPRHRTDVLQDLLDPADDFSMWRNYVADFEGVIPVAQFVPDVGLRAFVRQAQLLERRHQYLAFRVRDPDPELPLVVGALSALDDVGNALVYVDLKYVRDTLPLASALAQRVIDRIRHEIPQAMIVLLGSSFPAYLGDYAEDDGQTRGVLEILERKLHASVQADGRRCAYGDYASVHPVIRHSTGGGSPVPRIDVAFPFAWQFQRRPALRAARREAYVDIASALLNLFTPLSEDAAWGARMIRQAAAGDPHSLAAASWTAVRVNLHLSRQIAHAETDVLDGQDDVL